MQIETKRSVDPLRLPTMTTDEIRRAFLVEGLFVPGEMRLVAWELDRTIVGSVVPTRSPLPLGTLPPGNGSFTDRRELAILNIGGAGVVSVGGETHPLRKNDALYVGLGAGEVVFGSSGAQDPARFYLLSHPAHSAYPTRKIDASQVEAIPLGNAQEASRRYLRKYIHAGGVRSCQLVMGVTRLEEGSVWNTLPPHTHERRTEVYLYFDLPDDAVVFHFMGRPESSRHLVVRNGEAVLSPSWSFHSGVGTSAYTFAWGMGGENQDYDDMQKFAVATVR